jgi:WD40 repeat protein
MAASQTADGRVLVVTGNEDPHAVANVCMRMADSGELVGQWQGVAEIVYDVAIDVKAGMVMGAYGQIGLWIWSFENDKPGPKDHPVVVADGPPRAMESPSNMPSMDLTSFISSIAFSGDGHVAVSCSYNDTFVLVWDTATGMSTRQLDIGLPNNSGPRAVAISNSGDWILCAGDMRLYDSRHAFVYLWGPSSQELVGHFMRSFNVFEVWAATIISQEEQMLHGAVLVERKDDVYEMYSWALSTGSEPEIIVAATETPEDVASEWKQARQGSLELLLLQPTSDYKILLVRKAAVDGEPSCSCKTAAVFDTFIHSSSAWSETPGQSGAPPSTSSKVAVGLEDGTVHFMELR